jgi:peptidoglycan LD-endopeptidase CwlK
MINSRDLNDLHPAVKKRADAFLAAAKKHGIDLLVTSTYRDNASQAYIYAQGRTRPGKRVTNAKPGQSMHNWRVAIDVVPIVAGKPVWDTRHPANLALWNRVGTIAESVGLEWSGRWKNNPEFAHVQYTGGLSLADLQAGKVPQ